MVDVLVRTSEGIEKTKGIIFNHGGFDFAWLPPKNRITGLEFIHIETGMGMTGSDTKKQSEMMESFNVLLSRFKDNKFLDVMESNRGTGMYIIKRNSLQEKNL